MVMGRVKRCFLTSPVYSGDDSLVIVPRGQVIAVRYRS